MGTSLYTSMQLSFPAAPLFSLCNLSLAPFLLSLSNVSSLSISPLLFLPLFSLALPSLPPLYITFKEWWNMAFGINPPYRVPPNLGFWILSSNKGDLPNRWIGKKCIDEEFGCYRRGRLSKPWKKIFPWACLIWLRWVHVCSRQYFWLVKFEWGRGYEKDVLGYDVRFE